jgi:hypothetical protein
VKREKTVTVQIRADRANTIMWIVDRIKKDPNELYYFEAMIDVLESIDEVKDMNLVRSAMLSRVAVKCPWLIDRVVERSAKRAMRRLA